MPRKQWVNRYHGYTVTNNFHQSEKRLRPSYRSILLGSRNLVRWKWDALLVVWIWLEVAEFKGVYNLGVA